MAVTFPVVLCGTQPSLPADGRWSLDPDTGEYRAWPHWLDMDFDRRKGDGKFLAAMCVPNCDGLRSRLEIWGLTGNPEAASGPLELEASHVSSASIGWRPDGRVEVFYIHNSDLKHRVSLDGGGTFEASTTITLTSALGGTVVPAKWAYTPGFSETNLAADRYVLHTYDHQGRLILLVQVASPLSTGTTPFFSTVVGTSDGATGWTYSVANEWKDIPQDSSGIQLLRSGRFVIHRTQQTVYVYGFTASGNRTATAFPNNTSDPSSNKRGLWIDERLNMRVGVKWDVSISGASSALMNSHQLIMPAGGLAWQGASGAFYSNSLVIWEQKYYSSLPSHVFTSYRRSSAMCMKPRRDGVWEWLYLATGGVPTLVECRSMSRSFSPTWS